MNAFTIPAGRAHIVPFSMGGGVVRIRASADGPVNVYALDPNGRAQYPTGQFSTLGVSAQNKTHDFAVPIPPTSWFLVLENRGSTPVSGAYAVSAPMLPPTPSGFGGPSAMGGGWGSGSWGGGGRWGF